MDTDLKVSCKFTRIARSSVSVVGNDMRHVIYRLTLYLVHTGQWTCAKRGLFCEHSGSMIQRRTMHGCSAFQFRHLIPSNKAATRGFVGRFLFGKVNLLAHLRPTRYAIDLHNSESMSRFRERQYGTAHRVNAPGGGPRYSYTILGPVSCIYTCIQPGDSGAATTPTRTGRCRDGMPFRACATPRAPTIQSPPSRNTLNSINVSVRTPNFDDQRPNRSPQQFALPDQANLGALALAVSTLL